MKKTDTLNYNAVKHYSNTLLSNEIKNDTKRMTKKAFGLLLAICLKSGIRVSDLLVLKYSSFTENKIHPNTYLLDYAVKKSKTTNTLPIGHELMHQINVYRAECLNTYGFTSEFIFYNYTYNKVYSRVWASNQVSNANKKGLLGEIVNVAGLHSIRKTSAINLFDRTNDLKLVSKFLTHKNILTTSNYLQDTKKNTEDKLRELLC